MQFAARNERDLIGARSSAAPVAAEQLARYVRRCRAPLDLVELTPQLVAFALPHLSDPNVNQWLDFGAARQLTSAVGLQVLSRSRSHFVRGCVAADGSLAGVGGLHHIDHPAKNGMFWGVRIKRRPPLPNFAAVQTYAFMREAFHTLRLRSVYCWVAESNRLSARVLTDVGFRLSGRHRDAHVIQGETVDRLLFDLLDVEFFEREQELAMLLSDDAASSASVRSSTSRRSEI